MPNFDLTEVPGLTPALIQKLNGVGVFLTSDLMRSNRAALARAITTDVAEVLRWQMFATLAEMPGMSADAVRALLAAGIDRLEEVSGRAHSALASVLGPGFSADQVARLQVEARKLQYTGVLNGTVVTTRDVPLVGAVAEVAGQSLTTDARGRFRATGLRLGQTYTVSISHPTKKAKIFQRVAVHPSSALIGRKFKLTGRPVPLARLSALTGDTLPPLGTAPVTTEAQSAPLDPRDRYVLAEFYANGDGKLGSLFLDFQDGRFIVRTYRVKKADLPAGAALKDRFLVENGKLTKAKVTAGKVGRMTRMRGVWKDFAGLDPDPARMEDLARKIAKAMSDPT